MMFLGHSISLTYRDHINVVMRYLSVFMLFIGPLSMAVLTIKF